MSKKHNPKDEEEIQPVLYGPPVDEFATLIDESMCTLYGPDVPDSDIFNLGPDESVSDTHVVSNGDSKNGDSQIWEE